MDAIFDDQSFGAEGVFDDQWFTGVVTAESYGGVWTYGLKHWRGLRREKDKEPEPAVVEAVASVAKRTPQPADDVDGRLLLRLELEREGRPWNTSYLDTLAAYRAGLADYLAEFKADRRARREQRLHEVAVERVQQEALVREQKAQAEAEAAYQEQQFLRRRRLALTLLLLDA